MLDGREPRSGVRESTSQKSHCRSTECDVVVGAIEGGGLVWVKWAMAPHFHNGFGMATALDGEMAVGITKVCPVLVKQEYLQDNGIALDETCMCRREKQHSPSSSCK